MREFLFKRLIPFLVALFLGVSISAFFIPVNRIKSDIKEIKSETPKARTNPQKPFREAETGGTGHSGRCHGHRGLLKENYDNFPQSKREEKENCKTGYNRRLQILRQPRPEYTKEAREANFSGTVVLKITFSASGEVTNVRTIRGLPYGLTEQAITTIKKMKFEPEIKCGLPVSVIKTVEVGFNNY